MDCFRDKVAIVTGGASGIGRALCEELGRRGAAVIAADIDQQGAQEVSEAVSRNSGKAWAARLDVTKAEEIQKLIDDTVAQQGRVDYMFNNAGITIGGEVRDLGPEHWQPVLDVNLMGVLYGTTAAYSLMVKQGFGHIVNTASLCGIFPMPLQVPYATTKHAVVGLSTSLRAEGAALGVKTSVFCPGVIRTPLLDKATIVNSSMSAIIGMSRLGIMEVEDAIQALLRGVERNQAIIVCPFNSRMTWWLYRLAPSYMDNQCCKTAQYFRKKCRSV